MLWALSKNLLCSVYRLPEIVVECSTQNYYAKTGDNIPFVPTLPDLRLVISSESNGIDLFSGWLFSEKRYHNHHQNDEDKQPDLKDKPVGMPKPLCRVP